MFSETRYAMNGDLRVAYRASAEGPRDIVFVPNWFTCCELFPELPSIQGWVEAMTSLGRLIFFDQPGTGASDPVTAGALPTLEQWADSITAVLDDLGSREAVLVAIGRRVRDRRRCSRQHIRPALRRWSCSRVSPIHGLNATDGLDPEECPRSPWPPCGGLGEFTTRPIRTCRGTRRSGRRGRGMIAWRQAQRLTLSVLPLATEVDVRAVLPAIRVPTLVVQHAGRRFRPGPTGAGTSLITYRARSMSSCQGATCITSLNRGADSFQQIAEFLTGHQAEVADDRVLATVLFTDIVDSTRRAAEMGDRDWHALLDAHDAVVRSQLARFRGREVNTSGDGFLAMFDGPQRAIRCAMAIRDAVQALGIEVRAGLHTGECEVRGDDIGGIAVHIGARVSALAGPNDVLVSSTLRDLVIGSGLEFEDRGAHELKGVPGDWQLFAVASR